MGASADVGEREGDGDLPSPFHITSHENLLQFPGIPPSTFDTPADSRPITMPLVDAIVVPTIRTADHLRSAVQFAADARCHLITLYTDAPPAGLSAVLAGLPPGRVTVLTVRSGTHDRLLDLGASLPQSPLSPAALDISRKRNLGLLIGRVCGWTRMLFLDDDIRKLNMAKLSSAASLLDDYPIVGLQVKKYPDASVVGHARRLIERRHEPFISGGSLLVDPQRLNGYFVPVYHEDWLCVINHLRQDEVAIGGSVGQLRYLPFTTPERARFEEFGDILLSGLLCLVHASSARSAAERNHFVPDAEYWREATNPRFWKHVLEQRAWLLQDLAGRVKGLTLDDLSPLPSLAAAKQRLDELKPTDFVSFTGKWLTSLGTWRHQLSALSQVDLVDKALAIEKALAELGVGHVVRVCELSAQRARARGARRMSGFGVPWGRRAGTAGRRRFRFGLMSER
jgi:hypothetical protein